MGHNNGIITAPVNTDDVSSVLGLSSHDVKTLCMSDKINPACLFRPRYSSIPNLELRDTKSGEGDTNGWNWIKAQISRHPTGTWACPAYGVWVPDLNLRNFSDYSALFDACTKSWFIDVPDANSFGILDHFVGYNASAKVINPIVGDPIVNKRTGGGYTITVNFNAPGPDKQTLSISNLFPGWYLGICVLKTTNLETGTRPSSGGAIIKVSSTEISADSAIPTKFSLSVDDASAGTTKYKYVIIPFVCNKGGATSISGLSGTETYGLRIEEKTCAGYIEVLSDGTVVNPGGAAKDYYFAWNDNSGTDRYPMPDPKVVFKPTPSTYHPDILIVLRINNHPGTNIKDAVERVDIQLGIYDDSNVLHLYDYSWLKSGGSGGNGTLTRDTQKDNTGGYEDYLFFTIPSAPGLVNANPDLAEMTADIYYTDGSHDYGLLATFLSVDYFQ